MTLDDILAPCLGVPGVSLTRDDISFSLHLDTTDGCGSIRFFILWPGCTLAFVRVHAPRWPIATPPAPADGDLLLLNACLRGRCELLLNDGRYVYVADGELALSARYVQDSYVYPRRLYEGLEYFLEPARFTAACPWMKVDFACDVAALAARFCTRGGLAIAATPAALSANLGTLWQLSDTPSLPALRLQSLLLFAQLAQSDFTAQSPRTFYTASQLAIAKRTEALLTADLRQVPPTRVLAARFGVSETSLKNYFRGVYGQSPAAYLRQARMNRAAELLAQTRLPVSTIAESVGYLNQSKFASVFKRHFNVTPLEYRRQHHLEQG